MSRRSLLARASYAAAGSVVGQLLSVARAQEAAQVQQAQAGGICLSMLFESGPKSKFDRDKYVKKHLPLLREVYGDSVERIELRTPAASSMGFPAPMLATTTLWIRDVGSFSQKLNANSQRINDDLDAVAKGNRLVQPDRIVLALGEPRGNSPLNGHVFSLYYRAGSAGMMRGFGGGPPRPPAPAGGAPGAAPASTEPQFDQGYFAGTFLPKLHSLYGSDAVRRLEGAVGIDQDGQKATQLAAYHITIRDRDAYDQQAQGAFTELTKETSKFMQNIIPVFADMRITGVA